LAFPRKTATGAGKTTQKLIYINLNSLTRKEKELEDTAFKNWFKSSPPNENPGKKMELDSFIVDKEEIGYGINWYWVYKWDGKNWINDSNNHSDFYKTFVLDELQFDFKYEKYIPALPLLIDAASKGGPAAFVK
jgi:hypothetical protein